MVLVVRSGLVEVFSFSGEHVWLRYVDSVGELVVLEWLLLGEISQRKVLLWQLIKILLTEWGLVLGW